MDPTPPPCPGCGWTARHVMSHEYHRMRCGGCDVLDRHWQFRLANDDKGVFSIYKKKIGGITLEFVRHV